MNKFSLLAPQKRIQISTENMDTHDRVEKVKFAWLGAGIHLFSWRKALLQECLLKIELKKTGQLLAQAWTFWPRALQGYSGAWVNLAIW